MATIKGKIREAEAGLKVAGRDFYVRYINALLRSSMSQRATNAYVEAAERWGFVVVHVDQLGEQIEDKAV